jgi:hypothetical protein
VDGHIVSTFTVHTDTYHNTESDVTNCKHGQLVRYDEYLSAHARVRLLNDAFATRPLLDERKFALFSDFDLVHIDKCVGYRIQQVPRSCFPNQMNNTVLPLPIVAVHCNRRYHVRTHGFIDKFRRYDPLLRLSPTSASAPSKLLHAHTLWASGVNGRHA